MNLVTSPSARPSLRLYTMMPAPPACKGGLMGKLDTEQVRWEEWRISKFGGKNGELASLVGRMKIGKFGGKDRERAGLVGRMEKEQVSWEEKRITKFGVKNGQGASSVKTVEIGKFGGKNGESPSLVIGTREKGADAHVRIGGLLFGLLARAERIGRVDCFSAARDVRV
eukprot:663330-Pleurochrysis_carterae.AAC.1